MTIQSHSPPDGIAITAADAVCSLGLNAAEIFDGLCTGRYGFGPLPALEQADSPQPIGAQAPDLPADFAPDLPREARYLRHLLLNLAARSHLADYAPDRCAVIFGTTLHGMRAAGRFLRSDDPEELRNFLASSLLKHAIGDLPLNGMAITTCSACASGLSCVLLGAQLLASGRFDLVICGGYDPISEYAYAGFRSLQLQAAADPRPFDRTRDGLRLGEGYAAVVLEHGAAAKRRGAPILAWLRGGGESSDAHHLTQPDPTGGGAVRAIGAALDQARIPCEEIDGLFAHATATPDNDGAEYQAIRTVFGAHLAKLPVTAIKSRIGHCLGGAGAVELAMAVQSIVHQTIPPAAGTTSESLEFTDLQLVLGQPRQKTLRATLNISLGFGGSNAAVVLTPPDRPGLPLVKIQSTERQPVHISGIGLIVPGAVGIDAFGAMLSGEPKAAVLSEDELMPHLAAARRVRRLGMYTRLTLAATSMALENAQLVDPLDRAQTAAILGTCHGAVGYCRDYYSQIVAEGMAAANPMLFAEGVPNVAAAHLTMAYQLKAGSQTILGSRTAGLDAMMLAFDRIATGRCRRIVVSVAEEYQPLLDRVYPALNLTGRRFGHGAVTLVLESQSALKQRGARSWGVIEAAASAVQSGGEAGIPRAMEQVWRQVHSSLWLGGSQFDLERITGMKLPAKRGIAVHPFLPDLFSVAPVAALAAGLLGQSGAAAEPFTILAADCHGLAAGLRMRSSC